MSNDHINRHLHPERGLRCHECVHVAPIPGKEHVRCMHPKLKLNQSREIGAWEHTIALDREDETYLQVLTHLGGTLPVSDPGQFEIEVHWRWEQMGWFSWPLTFDPVGGSGCAAFEPIKEPQ